MCPVPTLSGSHRANEDAAKDCRDGAQPARPTDHSVRAVLSASHTPRRSCASGFLGGNAAAGARLLEHATNPRDERVDVFIAQILMTRKLHQVRSVAPRRSAGLRIDILPPVHGYAGRAQRRESILAVREQ